MVDSLEAIEKQWREEGCPQRGRDATAAEQVVARMDSYSQAQHVAGVNAARVSTGRRHLTTQLAIEAIEYERAPRYPGRTVNRRVVCADGFAVSVQASPNHYANDSSGEAPYWKTALSPEQMPGVAYPFTSFEVGYESGGRIPAEEWAEYDSDGTWAWVPPQLVAELLDAHGGAVAWEGEK